MKIKSFQNTYVPRLLAILSGLFLLVRSFQYANILPARLDESLFLYKGYLFANGTYTPFEPYGLWTNKNPLSFLIPGWFQLVFGAGLRSGRIFSILLGFLTILAVWIIVRKFTNEWFAFFAVAAIGLNPFYAWTFAQFISQSLAAALLAWMLVFTLGKDKPIWQIILGTILAVLVVQVRQNMLPVIPFLVLYIYWEDGKKAGTISFLVGLLSFIGLTAMYWPEIIRNYLAVIPSFMQSFALKIINLPDSTLVVSNNVPLIERIVSFTQGLRTHFPEILGVFFASVWIFLPTNKKKRHFKSVLFLVILFIVLFLAHVWASILKNFCVYCFSNYLAFFGILGVILFALCIYKQEEKIPVFWQILGVIFLLLLCTGAGFSIYQDTGHVLMELEIPRIKNMAFEPGSVELWTMLFNKFGLTYDELEMIIPTVFGFFFGLLFLGITVLYRKFQKKTFSFFTTSTILFAVLGCAVTFPLTEQQYGAALKTCSSDSISTYETIGEYLDSQIEPNSKVWWWGLSGQIILSYMDDIQIYPPQLNYMFNYLAGGTGDRVYALGYWNEELALKWLSEADYAIVENSTFSGDIVKWIDADQFDELPQTISINQCSTTNYFRIFRRK